MNQFSDSDTMDSEDGIRYKTDNVRTTAKSRKRTSDKDYSDRRRRRSSSKERSRHKRERRSRSPAIKKHKSKHKEKKQSHQNETKNNLIKENSNSIKSCFDSEPVEHCDMIAGPALPPHMINKNNSLSQIVTNSSKQIEDGPVVPSNVDGSNESPQVAMNVGDSVLNSTARDGTSIIGPALPPHLKNRNLTFETITTASSTVENNDDDDDDVYGPLPVDAAKKSNAYIALEERALQMKIDMLNPNKDMANIREEWMIELPNVQKPKLDFKPRQFRPTPAPDMSDR